MPPTSNTNYAWIKHMLTKLDVNHGTAGFLLTNDALNPDGDRAYLLERDCGERQGRSHYCAASGYVFYIISDLNAVKTSRQTQYKYV